MSIERKARQAACGLRARYGAPGSSRRHGRYARAVDGWVTVALRLVLVALVLVVTWRALPASGRTWVRSAVERAQAWLETETE